MNSKKRWLEVATRHITWEENLNLKWVTAHHVRGMRERGTRTDYYTRVSLKPSWIYFPFQHLLSFVPSPPPHFPIPTPISHLSPPPYAPFCSISPFSLLSSFSAAGHFASSSLSPSHPLLQSFRLSGVFAFLVICRSPFLISLSRFPSSKTRNL